MLETDNPYQSPRYPTLRSLDEDRPWVGGVLVTHVEAENLCRRIVFAAPLPMDLAYQGNIFTPDAILVDGQVLARETAAQFSLAIFTNIKTFDFSLRSRGRDVLVVVEARWCWYWPTLSGFRVYIDGTMVYSDDPWKPLGRLS
jgi:hypothetical protein